MLQVDVSDAPKRDPFGRLGGGDLRALGIPFRHLGRCDHRAAWYLVYRQNKQRGCICDKPENRTATTALALPALSVKYDYVPIYQR